VVVVIYMLAVHIFVAVCFFRSGYCEAFASFVANEHFCALHLMLTWLV